MPNVVQVSARANSSMIVKADGSVWTWGDNSTGQLGDGTTTDRLTPVPVVGLDDAVQVAMGGGYASAVKSDGTVWTWGGGPRSGDRWQQRRWDPIHSRPCVGPDGCDRYRSRR